MRDCKEALRTVSNLQLELFLDLDENALFTSTSQKDQDPSMPLARCAKMYVGIHTLEICPKCEGRLVNISPQSRWNTSAIRRLPDTRRCCSISVWRLGDKNMSACCKTTIALQDSASLNVSRRAFSTAFESVLISVAESDSKGRSMYSATHSPRHQLQSVRLMNIHTRSPCLAGSQVSMKQKYESTMLLSRKVACPLLTYLGDTSHYPAFADSCQNTSVSLWQHQLIERAAKVLIWFDIRDFYWGCDMLERTIPRT